MASLSIADMSPRLALQRILALFEKGEQREAAGFLNRLSITTFRQVLPDLPTDLFVESLPQVLPLTKLPACFLLINLLTFHNQCKCPSTIGFFKF